MADLYLKRMGDIIEFEEMMSGTTTPQERIKRLGEWLDRVDDPLDVKALEHHLSRDPMIVVNENKFEDFVRDYISQKKTPVPPEEMAAHMNPVRVFCEIMSGKLENKKIPDMAREYIEGMVEQGKDRVRSLLERLSRDLGFSK
ncbi:MAG: hypothetical protein H0Z28_11930 [Archaeoglobus sp.]|nr:hypothetical protein [Archaeoglobus sp.]